MCLFPGFQPNKRPSELSTTVLFFESRDKMHFEKNRPTLLCVYNIQSRQQGEHDRPILFFGVWTGI